MNFKKYHLQTLSTAVFPGANEGNFLYPALGLIGEVGEYNKLLIFPDPHPSPDLVFEEFGDIMWYLSIFCHTAEIDFETITRNTRRYMLPGWSVPDAYCSLQDVSEFAEQVKKLWRNGPEKREDVVTALEWLLSILFSTFARFYQPSGTCPFELFYIKVLERNAQKLRDRQAKNELKER